MIQVNNENDMYRNYYVIEYHISILAAVSLEDIWKKLLANGTRLFGENQFRVKSVIVHDTANNSFPFKANAVLTGEHENTRF